MKSNLCNKTKQTTLTALFILNFEYYDGHVVQNQKATSTSKLSLVDNKESTISIYPRLQEECFGTPVHYIQIIME